MAANDSLAEGKAALARGDWATARVCLAEAAASRPSGGTMEAIGTACWWQDDGKAVLETREAAYRLYREEGDPLGAARVATLVGVDYADYRGDFAVASGWLQRAESLLKGLELAVEHGWLHIYQGYFALMFNSDLPEAHRRLGLLRELTPRLRSVDLEMMAVGLTGLTAIREGDVERGMRYLDEAMAAATGGDMSDLAAIGNTCCSLIYACGAVAEVELLRHHCGHDPGSPDTMFEPSDGRIAEQLPDGLDGQACRIRGRAFRDDEIERRHVQYDARQLARGAERRADDGAEPDARFWHQDPCCRDRSDEHHRIQKVALSQRSARNSNEHIDWYALRLRFERCQSVKQSDTVFIGLSHTNDAAATNRDTCLAYILECPQPVVVGSRGDDLTVVLRRSIEIVVVCV